MCTHFKRGVVFSGASVDVTSRLVCVHMNTEGG